MLLQRFGLRRGRSVARFVARSGFLSALGAGVWLAAAQGLGDRIASLNGAWRFAFDPQEAGLGERWFAPEAKRSAWRTVTVPHTWQVEPGHEHYFGVAWYARSVAAEPAWKDDSIQLEFDAVFHDAAVWLNGVKIGEHLGSGYTPFAFSLDRKWDADRANEIVVRVDNRFSTNALPFNDSFDWPNDGGLTRGVRLRVRPPQHLGRIQVRAEPTADFRSATLEARAEVNAAGGVADQLRVEAVVFGPGNEEVFRAALPVQATATGAQEARLAAAISQPALWHFDRPQLYRLACRLTRGGAVIHEREVTFGIRKVEMRPGAFILNGEPMRLMGVEWMPGSDPRYGMAEDPRVVREVLTDLKRLNCVLTRFHWQQDDSVFEFCDREGILVQEEVPTWGPHRLEGEEIARLQEAHIREMILAHYNHPSIYAWGLCNEIKGLSERGRAFVARGKEIARALDPLRLLTYASNTVHYNPARDAAGLLDFIEWNEYFESWYPGGLSNVTEKLELIRQAYPDKGIVISEYGLCECMEKHPAGDPRRIEVLRAHTEAYRQNSAVAGAIFFSYNDYRTHKGDKGEGAFQQRVHGVVDLLLQRKPSWNALRNEASPVRVMRIDPPTDDGEFVRAQVRIETRSLPDDLPAYTLRGYWFVWTVFNQSDQPSAAGRSLLPDLPPASTHTEVIKWPAVPAVKRVYAEIFRPTGYSVKEAECQMGP